MDSMANMTKTTRHHDDDDDNDDHDDEDKHVDGRYIKLTLP